MGYSVSFVIDTSTIPDHVLSVRDVADVLRISQQRVRQLLALNYLRGEHVGSAWVVDRDSLVGYASSQGLSTVLPHRDFLRSEPKSKSLKVLSFFSGAMGLDLGMEAAGMETILACENDRASRETIALNKPEIPLLGNIWGYEPAGIRQLAGLTPGEEIDVMAGGPPCQAFSTAGARRGFADSRGNVFLRYVELISLMQPRYAILENVRGLLSMPMMEAGDGVRPDPLAKGLAGLRGGALRYAIRLLEEAGYTVSFNLYNSANFGSAQVRERVVLICSREKRRVPYLEPTNSSDPEFDLPKWKTFREVTATLPDVHNHLDFPESRLKYFRLLTAGQHWKHLPVELQIEALGKSYYLSGGKTGFLRRLSWDKPSPTLVTHPAMPATDLGHPELDRPLSIEEYKRVQDFPDSWKLCGNLREQYKQVGNAVPLKLGEAIGKAIVRHASGESWAEVPSFAYSRYKKTGDLEIRS